MRDSGKQNCLQKCFVFLKWKCGFLSTHFLVHRGHLSTLLAVCPLSLCPEEKKIQAILLCSYCFSRRWKYMRVFIMTLNILSRSCDGLTLATGSGAVCLLWCEIQGRGEARLSSVHSTWMQPGGCCLGRAFEWHRGHIMQRLHRSSFLLQSVQQLNKDNWRKTKYWLTVPRKRLRKVFAKLEKQHTTYVGVWQIQKTRE